MKATTFIPLFAFSALIAALPADASTAADGVEERSTQSSIYNGVGQASRGTMHQQPAHKTCSSA